MSVPTSAAAGSDHDDRRNEISVGPERPYWAGSRIIHNNAVCTLEGESLNVVTPKERWAYAVELPPRPGASKPKTTNMALKVRIRVHEGTIGLGLLSDDGELCYEVQVAGTDEEEIVEFPLRKFGSLHSLMIRNTSAIGGSRAEIEVIGWEISQPPLEIVIDPAIFAPFKPWSGHVPKGFFADWTGILTRIDVWAFGERSLAIYNRDRREMPDIPLSHEHVLDWIPLVHALKRSSGTFQMAALGAGWGRWLAAGAALARQLGRDYRLLGVEAEPQHFEWMLRHFKDNDIPVDRYIAINAAAVGTPGDCLFAVGNSQAWYGQSVYSDDLEMPENAEFRRTKGVTIKEILDRLSPLDYLHLDIQGAELDVLSYLPDRLDQAVRIVNIGTHSTDIEVGLRKLFTRLGWESLYDIKLGSERSLRVGDEVVPKVEFGDGVQVWQNPRLRA